MKLKIAGLASAVLVSGCAAIVETPNAQNVVASYNPPPKTCKYVKQVVGNQGNFFTGGWTSNKNLEQGSMNDMKNQAAGINANYIQMLNSRAGNTGSSGHGSGSGGGRYQQTNVTNIGNAYKCPPKDIGL